MLTFIDLMLLCIILILLIEIIDDKKILLVVAFMIVMIVGTLQTNFTFSGNEANYSYTVLLGIELLGWHKIITGKDVW